jgi:hypothetical protein
MDNGRTRRERAVGLDQAELEAAGEWNRSRPGERARDGRICLCGHPVTRHRTVEIPGRDDEVHCRPGRTVCLCKRVTPAIEVRDTRLFLAKTEGPGRRHALLRGLALLAAKYPDEDVTPEELVVFACGACGSGERVVPIAVDRQGRVSAKTERVNGLACARCLEELPRSGTGGRL